MAKIIKRVNGMVVAALTDKEMTDANELDRYAVFTQDEWEQGAGNRYADMCFGMAEHAISFAVHYNDEVDD